MAKIIMTNVKKKFSKARENCVGMSDEIYAVTDYISAVAEDSLEPLGLVSCCLCVLDDIEKERCSFSKKVEFPEIFINQKVQIKAQFSYLAQIVDSISEENFVEEFRMYWKTFFGFNPTKRVNADVDEKYPDYIKAAVDWWANSILSPKLDNGEEMPLFMNNLIASSAKEYSEEDIKIFKDTLAAGIMDKMKENNSCTIFVDYNPCLTLAEAGKKIGVPEMTGYPWKTDMIVQEDVVKVIEGYGQPYKIIWSRNF